MDPFATPLTPFLLALALGALAWAWGARRAPRPAAPPARREPYVGGERSPAPARPGFPLYALALLYTVLHVAALALAAALGAGPLAFVYLGTVILCLIATLQR